MVHSHDKLSGKYYIGRQYCTVNDENEQTYILSSMQQNCLFVN